MTERRTLRSTETLRRHLLTGASVAVIALASAAVVTPTGALAQTAEEIDGANNAATSLDNNEAVTSGAGGDFGVIDTNGGGNTIFSITLTGSETIHITDGDATVPGEEATIANDFAIANGETATLVFGENASNAATDGATENAAVLTVLGDLDGDGAGAAGGDLDITVLDGLAENGSAFNVNGSTNLDAINITSGAATADPLASGDFTARFGDSTTDDNFELASTLDITGGLAVLDNAGGAADVTINANQVTITGVTTVDGGIGAAGADAETSPAAGGASTLAINVGATGGTFGDTINIIGGNGGDGFDDAAANGDTDGTDDGGTGGAASFTLSGGTSTGTTLVVTGGTGGIGGDAGDGEFGGDGGTGGAAEATIDVNTTLSLSGDLTVNDGADGAAGAATGTGSETPGAGGTGGGASLIVNGTLNAGDALVDSVNVAGGTISVNNGGQLVIAGSVDDDTSDGAATGAVTINDGGVVLFNGAGAQASDEVAFNGAGTLRISEDATVVTFTDADIGGVTPLGALEINDDAQAIFDFDDDATVTVALNDVSVGAADDTDVSVAEFRVDTDIDGDVTIGAAGSIRFDDDGDNTQDIVASIAGNVTGDGGIVIEDTAGGGGGVSLTFDGGTQTQMVAPAITFDVDGQGIVSTANTAGLTFDGPIGADALRAEDVTIGNDNVVTFDNFVFTDAFTVPNDGTDDTADAGSENVNVAQLEFNAGAAGVVETQVTVDDGTTATLALDDADILLGLNIGVGDTVFDLDGTTDDGFSETAEDGGIVLSVSSNVGDGNITIIDGDTGDEVSDAELAAFAVNQTALTELTLDNTDDGGTANANLVLTADRRTIAEIADALNISTEQAAALASAVDAAGETYEGAQNDENEALVDAFTGVLNNTNGAANLFSASAQTAAETVGTQSSTLGGASQTAFTAFGDIFSLIANSGGGFGGFDLLNGFGGGDLIVSGPSYSAPAMPSRNGSIWGMGFGGIANADGDTNFEGYDANYGGIVIGVDGAITKDFTVGAFGTYFMSTVDGDGPADAEIEADTFGFGAYASYDGPDFYLDAFAAYGMSDNDLTRTATVGALTQRLSADYDASQFSIGAAVGVPLEVSVGVYITPNASLTWNHYDADTYTETGGTLAQTVNSDTVSQLTGTIGARIHAVYDNFDSDGTVFIPELRVALIGDIADDDATASVAFTGGGASYQVTGTDTDDIGALVGVGFGLDNPDWSAALNYDADIRGDFMSHTARAEFRWKF
ncbi:MAG: autotransporter outer membrane beta-barrel domain-containing protein [Pseudomonadota bacterium]